MPLERAAGRAMSRVRQRAGPRAAPRAAARGAAGRRCVRSTRRLPLRVPRAGSATASADGEELVSTDPGDPERVVATAAERAGRRGRRGRRDRRRAASRAWTRDARRRARRRSSSRAAAWMRERRRRARRARRSASAPSRGPRPTPTSARPSTSSSTTRAAPSRSSAARRSSRCPASATSMRYAPRGVVGRRSRRGTSRSRSRCGMVAAGLATGNTVVLKPAEQAPGVRRTWSSRRCARRGVPADALALLPGEGEAGAALVRPSRRAHDRLHRLGRRRPRDPAAPPPSRRAQRHLKRVVAEMGGKNCVIVDSDADLDDAVPAIVQRAFAYAGQKCSAASRVLVHEAIADALLERVAGAVEVLQVGQADDVRHRRAARHRARGPGARRSATASCRAAAAGSPPSSSTACPTRGWFVPPTVAADLPADSPVLGEEIFGPLLAVERVRDLDEAMRPRRRAALRADRRPVLPQPAHRRARGAPLPGRQPLRQPRDHRRDGRPPALRRQPPVRAPARRRAAPTTCCTSSSRTWCTENTVRHGLVI